MPEGFSVGSQGYTATSSISINLSGNWDTTPSKAQTEKVVEFLQEVMQKMRG